MLANAAAETIRTHHEVLPEGRRPTVAFVESIYFGNPVEHADSPETPYIANGFETEIENYVGLSALSRPFGAQQMTVGQQFFKNRYPENYRDPDPYMEVNRSLMNVWLYNLVRSANTEEELLEAHATFTDCQPEGVKLSWENFLDLKEKCDSTFETREEEQLFMASLIYADMGKSAKVLAHMEQKYGRTYADHDELVAHVLDSDEDIAVCMPSFLFFSRDEQKVIIDLFKSGFHLPQFQQAENLPYHLVEFQKLSRKTQAFGLLNGLFDIAGAVGDRVQNGSASLNQKTYNVFLKAWNAVFSRPDPQEYPDPTPQQIAEHSYETYLRSRAEEWDFDISIPEQRAFTRLGCMMRSLSVEEIQRLPYIFEHHQGELSKILLLDTLNNTGFEEEGGALWFQYHPSLLMTIYNDMRRSGVSYDEAMIHALAVTPRISTAVRKAMDITREPVTTVSLGDMVRNIEKGHWKRLLTRRIVIKKAASNEAKATLEPMPSLKVGLAGLGSTAIPHAVRRQLAVPAGQSLYVSAGGGGDVYFEPIFTSFSGAEQIARVSPRGTLTEIRNAEQISAHTHVVTPSTELPGARGLEATVARRGGLTYLVQTDREQLPDGELDIIADHAEARQGPITSVVLGDSGGDILLPVEPGTASRDHNALTATAELEERLRARNMKEGLGGLISKTFIIIPGEDYHIPDTDPEHSMHRMALRAEAVAYDITPHMADYLAMMEADGLPSSSWDRFSSRLATAHRLFHQNQRAEPRYAVEPLDVPLEQAMRRVRPWVPYTTLSRSMNYVLAMDSDKLRNAVNLSSSG